MTDIMEQAAGTVSTEIAIIGGGTIGMTIALRLRSEGHEVAIIEPGDPGMGASYGNAGTIADYAIMPVGTPAVLKNLPSLLFDRDSPLAIRKAYLPLLFPWLLRFAWQSLPANAARNTALIAGLLAGAAASWRELAAEIGGAGLIRENGALYLYSSKKDFLGAQKDFALRRNHGVMQVLVGPDEVAALEPALPPIAGGGVHFRDAIHLADPGGMMRLLAAKLTAEGVVFLKARAQTLTRVNGSVEISAGAMRVRAKRVVIAAGAHSRALAAQAGSRVPLETERGYHLEYDMDDVPLTRPTCPTERGFYFIPMNGRLRVAGTVELGGTAAPPSPHRLAALERGARAVFPFLADRTPDRTWMGFRPSMPDSVPVIGPSGGGDDVILAFGHGHIGLTLSPVTARIVSGLISRRGNGNDIAAYSPARF